MVNVVEGKERNMILYSELFCQTCKKMVFPRILKSKVDNVNYIGEHFLALCPTGRFLFQSDRFLEL